MSCKVGTVSYAPPPAQPGCSDREPARWKPGGVVTLEDGQSGSACTGEVPVATKDAVLPYGSTVADERYSCRSEKIGVTCVDLLKRRGFRVAESSYVELSPTAVDKAFPGTDLALKLVGLDAIGTDTVTFQTARGITQPNQGYQVNPTRQKLKLDAAATFASMGGLCEATGGLNPWTYCTAGTARGLIAALRSPQIAELITHHDVVLAVRQQWVP